MAHVPLAPIGSPREAVLEVGPELALDLVASFGQVEIRGLENGTDGFLDRGRNAVAVRVAAPAHDPPSEGLTPDDSGPASRSRSDAPEATPRLAIASTSLAHCDRWLSSHFRPDGVVR